MSGGPGSGGFAASLRVYEPLAAFEPADRTRWEQYAAAGAAPAPEEAQQLERLWSLRAVAPRLPSALPPVDEHALVASVDGVTLVCPLRTSMRAAEALVDVREGLPDLVGEVLAPRALVAEAEVELDRHRVEGTRSHVLTSTWHVPLRWFALVEPEERTASVGDSPLRTGRRIVYRTQMSRARRRAARALAVLRRAVDDGPLVLGLEDLARWLEDFHPRSLVELDYGGLVHLLDDQELDDDPSRDVGLALQALADDRPDVAAAAAARVQARMKELQAVESAN